MTNDAKKYSVNLVERGQRQMVKVGRVKKLKMSKEDQHTKDEINPSFEVLHPQIHSRLVVSKSIEQTDNQLDVNHMLRMIHHMTLSSCSQHQTDACLYSGDIFLCKTFHII